ncbi:MAG TPA: NAD+ synthase [Burkholderiales bacterium]|jgi:NAD+ synthase|nr:NAD+ synthase [Burkholderiales bacterium]
MPAQLSIALAQINPTVGDLDGNAKLILETRAGAAGAGANLVVFPEFVVSGYPPEDLVLRPSFQEATRRTLEALAAETAKPGPALLVSSPWVQEGRLYNAALLLAGGGIAAVRLKHELPNYGVFDEKRVFSAGGLPDPVEFAGASLGAMICEDMWLPEVGGHLAARGAEILIVPNGSPFELDKHDVRRRIALERVRESRLPLIYVNQVGGQDELVFDGGSFVMAADGTLAGQCPYWRADLAITRWERDAAGWRCVEAPACAEPGRLEAVYQAMVLGLRDYVEKNRFPGVVLGLSGGIDSALSAAVAVDALGAARVHCVMLPSKYTSKESLDEAADCARRLGVKLDTISIAPLVETAERTLAPLFAGRAADLTEENIQSRLRGVLLMALSNKFGPMVLTTGNKSEVSVGYATLYGDMCGGYSVLKDVYKVLVFELARWRNAHRPEGARGPAGVVIPESTIARPPTAELRPNQKDQDSLPPYEQLDAVLEDLVENELPVADIVAKGYSFELVTRVQNLLYGAEYKRRQASPGVKVTRRNFGRDRRYPITNRFRNR